MTADGEVSFAIQARSPRPSEGVDAAVGDAEISTCNTLKRAATFSLSSPMAEADAIDHRLRLELSSTHTAIATPISQHGLCVSSRDGSARRDHISTGSL